MVFGTPTTGKPCSRAAGLRRRACPRRRRDERVEADLLEVREHRLDAAVDLVRVRARRAEDRPAARKDPGDLAAPERREDAFGQALPAVADADQLVPAVGRAPHDRADDRVQAGTVAPAREDSDPHLRGARPSPLPSGGSTPTSAATSIDDTRTPSTPARSSSATSSVVASCSSAIASLPAGTSWSSASSASSGHRPSPDRPTGGGSPGRARRARARGRRCCGRGRRLRAPQPAQPPRWRVGP